MEPLEQVEIKLLNYTFQFRKTRWREEFAITFPKNKDPQRVMLASALIEVSGLKPKDFNEALKVLDAIPQALISRIFRIWKGSFPPSRRFTISKLYRAPELVIHNRRLEEEEMQETEVHDKAVKAMESKFGSQELADTREIERKILTAARRKDGSYKGATPASNDGIEL